MLHKCDLPACVNVSHLYLGSMSDNAQDRERRGRAADFSGEYSGMAKLTWGDVERIRSEYSARRSLRFFATEFGVSKQTIHKVVHGDTWRCHV